MCPSERLHIMSLRYYDYFARTANEPQFAVVRLASQIGRFDVVRGRLSCSARRPRPARRSHTSVLRRTPAIIKPTVEKYY